MAAVGRLLPLVEFLPAVGFLLPLVAAGELANFT